MTEGARRTRGAGFPSVMTPTTSMAIKQGSSGTLGLIGTGT